MDLAVKFEDIVSTGSFLVLDIDKYDLILGMPWLEKHEPWIDWRGKAIAIGASRPAVSDRALASNVPTSARNWGARNGRQGAYAPEEVLGVTDSNEDVAMSLATGRETKAHYQARGIVKAASPNAESRRAVWSSTVAAPDRTDQGGNTGPQAAEAAEESTEGVSCVGNIGSHVGNIGPQAGNVVPQAGNIGPQAAEVAGKDAESASGVGNTVPHEVEETEKKIESAVCASSVGNRVPRGVKKTSTRAEVSLNTSLPHSESENPPARPVEEQYHVFDGVSGRQVKSGAVPLEALPEVSALLNLEELSLKDFLVELKTSDIAEMVLLKPGTSPKYLNTSSVTDEDVLGDPQNLGDPVHCLIKEFSDVVSKHPPSQLTPDRGIRHEIDLWPLLRKQREVIDAFLAKKATSMVPTSKSLRLTPTFCVRKPNGKWRLVHAYNKLNNTIVPTPIPCKDVLLNNMSGCTLYSALDLVDGYYQILMWGSNIPLTAVSTPSGMLWEWLVMPHGLSNAPAAFNRFVTQLFRPLRMFAQTNFDDIFVHSRAEGGQTAMEVHLKRLRRVFEAMTSNKLYANTDKCVLAAEEIKVLGCFGRRTRRSRKVKAIAAWPTPKSQKDVSAGYAELARPLSDLLKNDVDWVWEQQHQDAFDSIKTSLQLAPVLALPDENKSFSVVWDASDYAIGCAL
ncbi:LOW QUALITY PROTEIN: Pol protein [Phytophthora palmivora]|uniref:Pol protein n=1 Tax=Phytophthora palmivora TaxID=4796 RepID=A0A2P4YDX3_9STRA|nr:LOW QUALITY PROTEIN: Pol protein [Phytophthora palmivora]